MHFYVFAADGAKYGPADVETLNAWIADGRVDRRTKLEHVETGAHISAGTTPGLKFSSPTPPPIMSPNPRHSG